MTIVIVEDDLKIQRKVKDLILKSTFERTDIITKTFTKYDKQLATEINNLDEPKIYILDIDLDGIYSGIQIAQMIRAIDWNSHIIFMTVHDDMFEQTYREVLEVFDFVEKFHNMEKRLVKDLKLIISKKFDNELFIYKSRNIDLNIYLKEITFIERDTNERKLAIHTAKNTFLVSMTLKEIQEKLDNRFKQLHKSCIANTSRIELYDWNNKYFQLDTGSKIYLLSEKYKKEVTKDVEYS